MNKKKAASRFMREFANSISTDHRYRLRAYVTALAVLLPVAVVMDMQQVPEAITFSLICALIIPVAIGTYYVRNKGKQ